MAHHAAHKQPTDRYSAPQARLSRGLGRHWLRRLLVGLAVSALPATAFASVADAGSDGRKIYKVPDLAVPASEDVKEASVIPVVMTLPKGMTYVPFRITQRHPFPAGNGGWFQGGGYASGYNQRFQTATPNNGSIDSTLFAFGWQKPSPRSCKDMTHGTGTASSVGNVHLCRFYFFTYAGGSGEQNEILWKPSLQGYLVLSLTFNYRATKQDLYPANFDIRVFTEALAIMESANRVG